MTRPGSVSPIVLALFAVATALSGCGSCDNGGDGDGADSGGTCGDEVCEDGEVCRYDTCVAEPDPCVDGECPGDFWCDETSNECLPWGVGDSGSYDEECVREAVAGVFVPGVQCEWTGPVGDQPRPDHKNVLGAPMVADFGLSGSGSEFSNPSIVFVSYNFTDGGTQSCAGSDPSTGQPTPQYFGVIRIIDGRTCELLATLDEVPVLGSPSVAIGDLSGDGIPEIVAARNAGGLVAYTKVAGVWQVYWQTESTYGDATCNWAGPSIHDLDDDGIPEVIHFAGVYAGRTGAVLDESLAPDPRTLESRNTGYIPVIADVDADGLPELITGPQRYAWDTANTAWVAEGPAMNAASGRVAVADLGTFVTPGADDRGTLDGIAEVIVVDQANVHVWSIAGHEVFQAPLTGVPAGSGGPPTAADFDGDGRVEIAVAGATAYTVFDYDCTAGAGADVCPSGRTDRVLWAQPSQDASSNVTGSSVFDFEGDGRAEVVYADECFTRVYDGVTGDVMYSRYRTSCTWYELPIIADVDADFNAEIVVGSNENCNTACPPGSDAPYLDPIFDGVSCLDDADCVATTTCVREQPGDNLGRCRCVEDVDCGGDGFVCRDPIAGPSPAGKVCRAEHPASSADDNYGVRVISDQLDRWVNTRRIWNQHAYSVTNVSDDGTIPRTSQWQRNWDVEGLNNYRQNSPGEGIGDGLVPTPDLTVRSGEAVCGGGMITVTAQVCNRGTEPVGAGVPISFYEEGASTATCTATLDDILREGYCTPVECTWAGGDGVVTIIVDDDGSGLGSNTECQEDNNVLEVDLACP